MLKLPCPPFQCNYFKYLERKTKETQSEEEFIALCAWFLLGRIYSWFRKKPFGGHHSSYLPPVGDASQPRGQVDRLLMGLLQHVGFVFLLSLSLSYFLFCVFWAIITQKNDISVHTFSFFSRTVFSFSAIICYVKSILRLS